MRRIDRFWDMAFAGGSYVAAFSQGVALGAFINGFHVTGPSYQGGAFDWLTPFSIFTGFGLLVAYALLGSTWLIMKTEGALQQRMIALAQPVTIVLLVVIGIVSIWTPLAHPRGRGALVQSARTLSSSRRCRCSTAGDGLGDC